MRITRESTKKILIFFATYNEVDNIENLLKCTFEHLPGQEVLVVDDDSPDGTGDKLDIISQNNKHVTVIHRPRKLGLGTAHKLAMQYAIKNKFDILITMDADFSHHPEYLPTLVDLMNDNDFVIGSRYAKGGGVRLRFFQAITEYHCKYFNQTYVENTFERMHNLVQRISSLTTKKNKSQLNTIRRLFVFYRVYLYNSPVNR